VLKVIKKTSATLVVVACLTGCSTVQVQHNNGGDTGAVSLEDSLTVVLDYSGGSPQEATKLEARLSDCVHEALREQGQAARLILANEFRRAVFPNFDITSAPRSTQSLLSLLKIPQFRQSLDSLGLRFIVVVQEDTSSQSEYFGVGGGYPGWGIVGSTHEKRTELIAHIIDTKSTTQTDAVSTTAESAGFYGLVVILPIIVPAVTESAACQRFGMEIVKSIFFDVK